MNTSPHTFQLGYRPALNGLRAIAILLVMVYHSGNATMRGGFLGVDVFFVLSGFLITTILVQEWQQSGTINLRRFYIRRVLRLLPALLVLLGVLIAVCAWQNSVAYHQTTHASVVVLLYLVNMVGISDPYAFRWLMHTWSLSMEEQFYILFPLALWAIAYHRSWRRLQTWLLVAIVGVNVWRVVLAISGAPWYRIYYGLDTRVAALLWGCWLAITLTMTKQWRTPFWTRWARRAIVPALFVLAWLSVVGRTKETLHLLIAFPTVAIIATILVFYIVTAPRGRLHRVLESPLLEKTGKISYGLYLWHFPIYYMMLAVHIPASQILLFGTGLTFVAAICSYYFVEKPCLRLSARLARTSAPASTQHGIRPALWQAERGDVT